MADHNLGRRFESMAASVRVLAIKSSRVTKGRITGGRVTKGRITKAGHVVIQRTGPIGAKLLHGKTVTRLRVKARQRKHKPRH